MESYHIEKMSQEANQEFDRLLDYVQNNADSTEAYEMEKGIFQMALKIGLAAMKLYFQTKGPGDHGTSLENVEEVILPRERERSKPYFTIFGELKLSQYCYRSIGVESVYPLDEEANLPSRKYSYLLQQMMGSHSNKSPFRDVVDHFSTYFGHSFSPRSVEQVTREAVRSFDAFYEEKPPPEQATEGELQVVSFDGKGVPVVKAELAVEKGRLKKGEKRQKKKEALVGVSYTIDCNVRGAEEVTTGLVHPPGEKKKCPSKNTPRGKNKLYVASIERSKGEVMDMIKEDAADRNASANRPVVCLLDGARSLWRLAKTRFPGAVFILDIVHVLGYLWDAVTVYHPEGSDETHQWVRSHLQQILNGNVGTVINGLKMTLSQGKLSSHQRKTLTTVIGYFHRNSGGMKYDEYLRAGYPIGTGVVESACRHVVKDRMEGAGMRWTFAGAEAMLLLRSLNASGDWQEYYEFHVQAEKKRLYWGEKFWQIPTLQSQGLALTG